MSEDAWDPEVESQRWLELGAGDAAEAQRWLQACMLPWGYRPCDGGLWMRTWNHLRRCASLPEARVEVVVDVPIRTRASLREAIEDTLGYRANRTDMAQVCGEWAFEHAVGEVPQRAIIVPCTGLTPDLFPNPDDLRDHDHFVLAWWPDQNGPIRLCGFATADELARRANNTEGIPSHRLHAMYWWGSLYPVLVHDGPIAVKRTLVPVDVEPPLPIRRMPKGTTVKRRNVVTFDLETVPHVPDDLKTAILSKRVEKAKAKIKPEKPRSNNPKPETLERIDREYKEKLAAVDQEVESDLMEGAALSPMTGRIVACGYGVANGDKWQFGCMLAKTVEDEPLLLGELDRVLAHAGDALLVITFNGRRFDLPFVAGRAIIHNLALECPLPLGYRREEHVDLLQDVLGGSGGLGEWCVAMGGKPKLLDGGGKYVATLVDEGRWDEVEAYALDDAKKNAAIWNRARRVVRW